MMKPVPGARPTLTGQENNPLARFDQEQAFRFHLEHPNEKDALVAGVDEAGRGPLAGPVVAAAVVLPTGVEIPGVDDSKKLSEKRRDALFPIIYEQALSVGVGVVDAEEIDRVNILEATKIASMRALNALSVRPDLILLDALKLDGEPRPQVSIVKGDAQSQSIAAASIVAKVTRDRLMLRYDEEFPEYGFHSNKGYGSASHLKALQEIGPSTIHRLSFAGVCFFDCSLRRSASYHRMKARLQDDNTKACVEEIWRRLQTMQGFLPARELRELDALVQSAGLSP